MTKLVLLQHGPQETHWTDKTCDELCHAKDALARYDFSVVIQHYDNDDAYAQTAKKAYGALGLAVRTVSTSDLFYTGFFNIFRHVYTVSETLKAIDDDAIVIKLRNDQVVDFNKLLHKLEKIGFFENPFDRLVTTNCYTRRDRHYHPSDMFMCATALFLKEYFSLPLIQETHMDVQLRIFEMESQAVPSQKSMLLSPESQLFTHFLKGRQWNLLYTDEDSLNALRKYCLILNSWSIDFRWNKERTPGVPAGGMILPHTDYRCTPFPGGPLEMANCYTESDFMGRNMTQEEISYTQKARQAFRISFDPDLLATIGVAPVGG